MVNCVALTRGHLPAYVLARIAPVLPRCTNGWLIPAAVQRGETMKPNRDDDAVAIMLRFLLAATLATALCLAPVAIHQAKGLFFFLGN